MTHSDDRDRLAMADLWRGLEPATIDALLYAGTVEHVAAGSDVYRSGDPYREHVYILLEGALEQQSGRGDIRRAEPGDLLGLANYLDGADYRSTAHALTDCRVLAVPDHVVRRLERESPAFHEAINRALAARMRKARQVRETVRGTLARPVRQLMHSPLATCGPGTSLREAYGILDARQIGSLGVTGADGELIGLLTPMGIAGALIRDGAAPDDAIPGSACQALHTVTEDTPLWQVEELQERHRAKYVVVVDRRNAPLGMVSQTDLVRALATPPQTLASEIAAATDIDTLTALFERLPEAARNALETHRSPAMAVRALTDTHLALQHRAVELVLEHLERAGHGGPPARFALMIMGSGGRGEMLLRPDQDNGLIVEDGAGEANRVWFERFADELNPALDRIGYPLCPGRIMANNPEFRMTLHQWRARVTHLVDHPHEEGARWSTIVFDFATQYGNDGLTAALRAHVNAELRRAPGLLKMMAHDDAAGTPALGLFNRLVTTTHDGQEAVDIKRNGLRIIADAARVFALEHGITRTATSQRLAALGRLGVFDPDLIESTRIALEELQDLLLSHQLDQLDRGEEPDKFLRLARLASTDRERLRVSLRATKRLQDRLQDRYGVSRF